VLGLAMKDFQLTFSSLGYFIQEVTKLLQSDQTKKFRVNIVGWKEKRSISQNCLYWRWLTEISKQALIDGKKFKPETWHEYFKKYYCPVTTIEMPAGPPSKIISTTKLDTGQMHHYLNKVEYWAQDKGFMLTIPEICEYRELMERQCE
jgi:hypothetical protein